MEGLPISEQLSTPSVVTQIIAGTNITIDQPNGNVTINAPGAGPGGGVLTIAGLEGVVTLSSPGGTIGITVNDQDIELTNTGVVSVAAGTGVSVDTVDGVATVNNDGVLSISDGTNEPSTGAIVLSSGDGITVEDTAGTFAITNTGVTQLTGGDGIGIDTSTGSVTVSNLGLLSAAADPGIGVSTTTGVLTISNKGVRTLADLSGAVVLSPGTGIGVVTDIPSNTITLSNIGITSVSAGTAMGVSTASGVATVTNNGVQSFFDLSGAITVSATGATISKVGQNIDWTVNFPSPLVSSVGGKTGTVGVVSGAGIDVSGGAVNADPITIINKGVRTLADLSGAVVLSAGTGISVTPDTGTNTITVASTVIGVVASGTVDQTDFTEETTGPATGQYYKAVTVTNMEANGIVVATTSGTPAVCSSAWITTVIPTTNTLTFWVAANPVASGETWEAHYIIQSFGTAP
jgi:hypothetical protein